MLAITGAPSWGTTLLTVTTLMVGCSGEEEKTAAPAERGSTPAPQAGAPAPTVPAGAVSARPSPFAARLELPIDGQPEGVLIDDLDGDGRAELLAVTRSVVVRGDAPVAGALYVWHGTDAAPIRVPMPDYLVGPRVVTIDGRRFAVCASRVSSELWFVDPLAPDPLETRSRIPLPGRPRALGAGPLDGAGTWTVAVATKEGELVLFDPRRGVRAYPLEEGQSTFVEVFEGRVVVGSQGDASVRTYTLEDGELRPGEKLDLGGFPRAYLERAVDGARERWIAGGDESLWIARGGNVEEHEVGAIPIDLEVVRGCGVLVLSHSDLEYALWNGDILRRGADPLHAEYAGQDAWAAATGDLDGDGYEDLAFANRGASRLSVVFGSGACGFEEGRRVSTPKGPHSLAAGDLDGDGSPEVVSLAVYDDELSVLARRGADIDGFERIGDAPTSGGADHARLADLDGDGLLDLAFLRSGGTRVLLEVRFGVGDGTFGETTSLAVGASKGDLLLYPRESEPPWILVADPDGGRVHVCSPPTGRAALAITGSFEVPSSPVALALVDIDGDGRDEIAAAVGTPGPRLGIALLELRPRAQGPSLAEIGFESFEPAYPLDLCAFDHDGQGPDEIALLAKPSEVDGPGVLFLLRRTAGSWERFATETTGQRPFAVAAGDVDGDGLDEIVVGAQNSHHVNQWRPTADGVARMPDLGAGRGVLDVLLHDLDGDGLADLACTNNFSNDVTLIRSLQPLRE